MTTEAQQQQQSTSAALRAVATGAPGASSAVAKKGPPKDFPAMLEAWRGEIARALPKHLNADRMARVALTCFRNVPKLADCDPKSVFAAVLQSAQLGIEPGLMGEAHLIPYGKECQLIPGYQGLVKLAKQTGQVVDIYAMAVRENDKISVTYGLTRTLDHQPLTGKGGFPASQKDRGDIIGFYAVAVFKDGTRTFVLMGKDEIDAVRDGSSGYQQAKRYGRAEKSPWVAHYEEMGNKTAIRRLCKLLPKSPELAMAVALDDAHHRGIQQNLDQQQILDGSYSVMSDDDPEAAQGDDAGTGGGLPQAEAQPAVAAAATSNKAQGARKREEAAAATPAGNAGPTFNDALNMVQSGDYDGARDLVKGGAFTQIDRDGIEGAIAEHHSQAGQAGQEPQS